MIVLSCGSNGNYQLGNGSDDDSRQLVPSKFMIDDEIVENVTVMPKKIVCGGNHTFILFEDSTLFATGDNTHGQCGVENATLGQTAHLKWFTKVSGSWKHVTCGWEMSVLVSTEDEVYVCGIGMKGELGLGKGVTKTNLTRLDVMCYKGIEVIRSSISLVVCKTRDGYYGWGDSKKGQFGEKVVNYVPVRVNFEGKGMGDVSDVKDFKLTKNALVILVPHQLILIGKTVTSIKADIEQFQTMWSSVHYKHQNTIHFDGNNSHGQKFPGPLVTDDFKYIVGSEHGIITVKNKVYAWGWGEHGNCGTSSIPDHDQITFNTLNLLYTGTTSLIAAGCATTWVVV